MAFNLPEYYQRLGGTFHIGTRDLATGKYSGGLTFVGDSSELTMTPSQEFAEHMEHQSGDGKTDMRIPRRTTMTGNLVLDNTGAQNFKNFMRGQLSTVSGATVTSETHAAPAPGSSFLLNSEFVDTFTSLTDDASTPVPYVAGTDYVREGRVIYIPVGSSIAENDPLEANYVSADATTVDLFGDAFKEYYVYFQGINTVNKKAVSLELYKVSFDPASLGNLLGDEIVTMTCAFTALFEPLLSTTGNLGGFGNYAIQD